MSEFNRTKDLSVAYSKLIGEIRQLITELNEDIQNPYTYHLIERLNKLIRDSNGAVRGNSLADAEQISTKDFFKD